MTKSYQIFLGTSEQGPYSNVKSLQECYNFVRKFYKMERTDIYKIRKLRKKPGYPSGSTHYKIIERTRVAGIERIKETGKQFLIIEQEQSK
jgi:hypothetical protein